MTTKGIHIIADLFECDFKWLNAVDQKELEEVVSAKIKDNNLTEVGSFYHSFGRGAYSGVVSLAESHLSFHTWPENSYISLDIYVCNYERDNTQNAKNLAKDVIRIFSPKTVKSQFFYSSNIANKYAKFRPLEDRNLDQFWATEDTVLRRVDLLSNIENISEKNVLFLGDDDLTSITLASVCKPNRITVCDIDDRIIEHIDKISKSENLEINLCKHDFRDPFPKNFPSDFDIVFFDPAYTPSGINNWLNRALEASLGKGSNKDRKNQARLSEIQYFLCFGYTDKSKERGLKAQQIISSLGLVIQEKFKHFNKYYHAESINSTSDLYILQPTPKVSTRELDIARSKFYTGHKAK